MYGSDGSNNDDTDCSTEEGIFDDVDDENDSDAPAIGGREDQNSRKRKIKSQVNIFCDLRRAMKRRQQRQEELEKQLDPEQFDDNEDSVVNSGAFVNGTSRNGVFVSDEDMITAGQKNAINSKPGSNDNSDTRTAMYRERAIEEEGKTNGDSSNALGKSWDSNGFDGDPFRHQNTITDRADYRRDRNQNINNATTSYFRFDERKFFCLPTFKPGVKEEAFRRIYAAVEAPLKALEDDGYEAYRQYVEYTSDDEIGCSGSDKNEVGGRFRDEKSRKYGKGLFRKLRSSNSHREREKRREESIRNSLRNAIVNGDPREYQRKIFEVARQRNTIVNLGTGAGKTLIALLLIRDVWSKKLSSSSEKRTEGDNKQPEKKNLKDRINTHSDADTRNKTKSEISDKRNTKKQTLFLVPSVALAIQQSLTLRANLPHLKVETACYASASSKRTRATLGRCDVIVATHGVVKDLLMHYGDTFRMGYFNLVVIDECHYAASGNHAYRHLMRKFYHPLEAQNRPRVLGLTASPLLNVKETHSDEHLSIMLDNLESTLDSKMFSALGLIASQEKDVLVANSGVPANSSTRSFLHRVIDERTFIYRGRIMNRTIPTAGNLDLLPSRYREFKQLEHLYKDLGPLVSSIYCAVLRRELSKNIFENESILQFNRALGHLRRIEEFCDQEVKFLPNMGRNDKTLALEELIETLVEEKGGAKTIGLVFVERRITAIALNCYFLWRNQQILDKKSDWKFAKKVRRQTQKLDTFFRLTSSKNNADQSDSGGDQFDDSVDDPFHIFQQRNEIQGEIAPRNRDFSTKTHEDNIDQFHTTQFMDAESGSDDDADDDAKGYSKTDPLHRLGRVVVKPVALVRNPVQIFNSLSVTQKSFKGSEKEDQFKDWVHRELNVRDVLNKLRRGDMNLLFATSVVEEGVDVQACSFVVAFDGLTNIKGYIQMKGRARRQDAKFFVFRDPYDRTQSKLELCVAQKMEHRIQRFIEDRMRIYAPKIHDITSHSHCLEKVTLLPKEIAAIEARMYKFGDATVDVQSAKSLLNRYFLSIPLDPFVRYRKESLLTYMPCFESNRLVLPVHLPSEIRTVVLPEKYTDFPRREKQKLLSLMACVRLHCHGLLNERLLPLSRKDMQSRIMQVATEKLRTIETVPLDLDSFYNDYRRQFVVYPILQKGYRLSKYCESLNGEGHILGFITTSPIKSIEPLLLYHAQFGKVDISIGEAKFVSCSKSEYDILKQIFVLLLNSRWSRRSRNVFYEMRTKDQYDAVIPPYLVGVLSSGGNLDWDFMNELVAESNRSVEERAQAALNLSSTAQLLKPRICCTSYNEFLPHIIFGPTGESCGTQLPYEADGVKTYSEYYKKVHSLEFSRDCRIFRAHRVWSLDSGLPTKPRLKGSGSGSENVAFDSIGLPQQAIIEQPLANAHIALLCLFLPQVLYSIERQEKTEAFIKHCEAHIPTLGGCFREMEFSRVALAVTSKSCNPNENYDRWEWVGDAVLKLLQTDSILKSAKFKHFVRFLHEGDLSMLRSAMGTNERLRQICTHLCLEKYIMMTSLARGKWVPCPLKFATTSNTKVRDAGTQRVKILADVIESILGVIYLDFGYQVSMKVGNELHVTFPWDETDTSVACGERGDIDNSELVNIVQKCTGHSKPFKRPKLLSEAFTHSSAIDASVPSYQRLEWIGDAVLCLCTREWLFRNLGERTTLGDLVVSEGAIVSNETLGFLSMKFGLQEYLNHRDQSLPKRIETYCWNIQEGCGLWGGDPPKPIADVVEAILGAIHVSCSFESGQEATRHLMSSIFSMFIRASSEGSSSLDTFIKTTKHPKKSLQEMTGQLFDVMACSEHDFASSYHDDDEDESDINTITNLSIPQILYNDEWRNPLCGVERGNDSCEVAFVSVLGQPLVVIADESITVAKNRASSLVREAIVRRPDLEGRMAKCRSEVESGLTFANRSP